MSALPDIENRPMAAVVSPSVPAVRFGAAVVVVAALLGHAAAWAQGSRPATPPAAPAAPPKPQLAFQLITPDEATRDRELRAKSELPDMPEVARSRSAHGVAPAALGIRVLMPTPPQAPVTVPLRIELAFETPPGVRVVPSTFRVLYGVLKIDLTERLRRFSTISERGVVVDQAVVPDGLHRLFLQVADDKGNVAEQELRLRVGVVS
ncbi:MAG: hypothetical protein IPM15_22315 [Betaproteobacteria bacterium]|nr:hypothetical protein [Betaproteobacteria bacterium]MCC6247176.1 hypothetical protein [Rubrivivax sp.]